MIVKKQINMLIALLSLIVLAGTYQAQANSSNPSVQMAYQDNVIRSQIKANYLNFDEIKSVSEALDAIITPIIAPSVYEDCMQHPEKYDIYDGVKTVETAPCFSNTCWKEETILHGVSMQPTIYDGATVYVRHDSEYNLSVGKIIAFDSLGQNIGTYSYNVIHRIVGIEPKNGAKLIRTNEGYTVHIAGVADYSWSSTHFLTNISETLYVVKGDNNLFCELVPENAIHGILVGGSI